MVGAVPKSQGHDPRTANRRADRRTSEWLGREIQEVYPVSGTNRGLAPEDGAISGRTHGILQGMVAGGIEERPGISTKTSAKQLWTHDFFDKGGRIIPNYAMFGR